MRNIPSNELINFKEQLLIKDSLDAYQVSLERLLSKVNSEPVIDLKFASQIKKTISEIDILYKRF